MLTKAKHTCSFLIERVFSGALADVGSSAFCENFISQKASVSKVATVTVTAEAVMLNPICPPRCERKWSVWGVHLILQLRRSIQQNRGQVANWKTRMGVSVIPARSQLAIQFDCCEMLSLFMVKITRMTFLKNLSGAFPSLTATTKLLPERRLHGLCP